MERRLTDEIGGGDLVHLEGGYLVDEDTYVVNAEDVLEQEENNSDPLCERNQPLREQDRFLPIANIAKIMKKAIPDNGKIAKDARECVQECISEFISFITSEASDRCQMEKRKTINGEDVLYAMNVLGFDNYVEPLKWYLKKYRELLVNPVTMNKMNNSSIILFEENEEDNEIDCNGDGTVVYMSENIKM